MTDTTGEAPSTLSAKELIDAKIALERKVEEERKRKEQNITQNVTDRETLLEERQSLKDLIKEARDTDAYYAGAAEVGELPAGFETKHQEIKATLKTLEAQAEEMAKRIDSLTSLPEVQDKLIMKARGNVDKWEGRRRKKEGEELRSEFERGDLGEIKTELEKFVQEDQERSQEVRNKRVEIRTSISENEQLPDLTRSLRGKKPGKKDKVANPDMVLNTQYQRMDFSSSQAITSIRETMIHYESELTKLGIMQPGAKASVTGILGILDLLILQELEANARAEA